MDFEKQDFWPRINCIQMKLPDFESPSGDSLPKSAHFGLSKWIFDVKNYPTFFLQNREKSKYHFDVFASNLSKNWATKRYYTSNEWLKSLFFGRFLCNNRKLNVRGPRTSDVTVKFIESPFSLRNRGPLKDLNNSKLFLLSLTANLL